jgi:hypothetical protein
MPIHVVERLEREREYKKKKEGNSKVTILFISLKTSSSLRALAVVDILNKVFVVLFGDRNVKKRKVYI